MKHVLFSLTVAAIMAFAVWHPAPRPGGFAAIATGSPIPAPSISPEKPSASSGGGIPPGFPVRDGKHRKSRSATRHRHARGATRHHRNRRSVRHHRRHHQQNQSSLHRLDLNHATAQALGTVPGFGSGIADRIVAFRALNGPFDDLDDVLDVSGVTPAHLDRAAPYLMIR